MALQNPLNEYCASQHFDTPILDSVLPDRTVHKPLMFFEKEIHKRDNYYRF